MDSNYTYDVVAVEPGFRFLALERGREVEDTSTVVSDEADEEHKLEKFIECIEFLLELKSLIYLLVDLDEILIF